MVRLAPSTPETSSPGCSSVLASIVIVSILPSNTFKPNITYMALTSQHIHCIDEPATSSFPDSFLSSPITHTNPSGVIGQSALHTSYVSYPNSIDPSFNQNPNRTRPTQSIIARSSSTLHPQSSQSNQHSDQIVLNSRANLLYDSHSTNRANGTPRNRPEGLPSQPKRSDENDEQQKRNTNEVNSPTDYQESYYHTNHDQQLTQSLPFFAQLHIQATSLS